MLTVITGKAGTGKTAHIINEIKRAVSEKKPGRIMIVPEQYSHEAERELAGACGDSLSLYAEVLSFTALARSVAARMGGGAAEYLDKGGKLLCMAQALSNIGGRLTVYSAAARRSETQDMLLSAVDEMKTACISPQMLFEAAGDCPAGLDDKLRDLALVAESYDAVVSNGYADPTDRLTLLASQIAEGGMDESFHVYIDGFLDFTAQQRNIIRAMLEAGVDVTVCLTVDENVEQSEIFQLSRRESQWLIKTAEELHCPCRTENFTKVKSKNPSLSFFTDNMFSYSEKHFEDEGAISLHCAESLAAECEFAAAKCLELVRDKNCRWRDIAVAVRGFDSYRGTLESVFEHYGVPLFATRMSLLPEKPLPLMIALVYELIEGGWDVDDVISYMHTGLSGLDRDECDILEAYVFKWQLRAWAWESDKPWRQHPDGYGGVYDEAAKERLGTINRLRRKLSAPLLSFREQSGCAHTATEQAQALAELFESMKLPAILEKRAAALKADGSAELAAEYQQLWEIVVSALEQCAAILGDCPMDRGEFGRLFNLMLSKYDVGTIPVSLDRVSAGDFDRMRRRSIKHLIVLGASDDRLPMAEEAGGIFSENERKLLLEKNIDLGGGGEWELWREFSLIYNCLSLPSETLSLCMSASGDEGEALRPAYVFRRAESIFNMERKAVDITQLRSFAEGPALSLAAQGIKGGGALARSAAAYFREKSPERFAALQRSANMSRGQLSRNAVRALYGSKLKLSASRIDKFASCKFAYFCQYGLKAKPYEPAAFKPPEIGTFMHYVLENLAREVQEKGGFKTVSEAELDVLCRKYVEKYIHEELNDFQEKSRRFIHLFNRVCEDVRQVVADMAQELSNSDFVPLSFELDFSKAENIAPIELGEDDAALTVTGIADRVDGWLHEDKLYLRVVDYKTGKKKFSLSDVWHGMGLQMLLYLFALQQEGGSLYGKEVIPAGVMYVPARNAMLSVQKNIDEDEAGTKRSEELRRSGLVLDDEALIEAWEKGGDKRFIPVHFSGRNKGEGLASLERLGLLSKRIKETLTKMAKELRSGSIAADPYYRSQQENACALCDYFDACHFVHGENGEKCRFIQKLSSSEIWAKLEGGEDDGSV